MLGLVVAPVASAQLDDERPGVSRGSSSEARPAEPDDPLRVIAFLGAGVGFRPVRNLDFNQDFMAPPFLDLGAAVFLPGGDLRHGFGLGITTSLANDSQVFGSVAAFGQWGFTPSYHLVVPLRRLMPDLEHDWLHIQGRVGLPLVFSGEYGGGSGVDVSLGAEVAAALHFKFLAGLGLYAELTGAIYGGSNATVHPVLAADFGFLFDYEVLP